MQKVIPSDAVLIPEQAKLAFKGMIFDVYQWPQELFDGSSHTFEMLKRPDTVTAICVVEDKILVINDEQPHLGSRQSFPGGRVDEDDTDTLSAAKREITEETGYSFKNWRLVKVWQPYRKMEWFVYVWLAWDVAGQQKPQLDAGEKITVQSLALDELKALIMQKVGYLGENSALFESIETVEQLMALREFHGQIVER